MTFSRVYMLLFFLFVMVVCVMAINSPDQYVTDRAGAQTPSQVKALAIFGFCLAGLIVLRMAFGMQADRINRRRMRDKSLPRMVWTGSGMTLMDAKSADAYEASVKASGDFPRVAAKSEQAERPRGKSRELEISRERRDAELKRVQDAGGNAETVKLLKAHRMRKRIGG